METQAHVKFVRMSPLKVRRVLNVIRGKNGLEALTLLQFMPYAAAPAISKILKSALHNAENNHQIPMAQLHVSKCWADIGPVLKRFQPHAQGRAFPIKKRTSHIYVVVSNQKTETN